MRVDWRRGGAGFSVWSCATVVSGFVPMMVATRVVEAMGASAGCVDAWMVFCRDRWRIFGLVW